MSDQNGSTPSNATLKSRAQRRLEEREARKAALDMTPERVFSRVANTSLKQFQELEKKHGKDAEALGMAENELVAGFVVRYMVLFGWLKGEQLELDTFGRLIAGAVYAARKEFDERRIIIPS